MSIRRPAINKAATSPLGHAWLRPKRPASHIESALATDVGRVRRNNEDFAWIARIDAAQGSFTVWVVADGVGGGPFGERASRLATETVIDDLATQPWLDPGDALRRAIALANRRVFNLGRELSRAEGSIATTLVVALIPDLGGDISVANVGDSRAYRIHDGIAEQITTDHSIVALRMATGQLSAAEARTAIDRNVLTRGVGSERDVLVDVFTLPALRLGERLLLSTDGLHGLVGAEVIARLAGDLPPAAAAQALVTAANDAGGSDNVTVIVGGTVTAAGPPGKALE
jgi:protein phosphatase